MSFVMWKRVYLSLKAIQLLLKLLRYLSLLNWQTKDEKYLMMTK